MTTGSYPLLSVESLTVSFANAASSVVDQVSFTLAAGETLGIVGESGSGKTLTALSVMGLTPPNAQLRGRLWYRDSSMDPVDLLTLTPVQMRQYRGDRLAMIFQEPMSTLNPVYTCGYQIRETIRANERVSDAEAHQRTLALFEEVQLSPSLVERYPFQLSGGQMQRVGIAAAIACNPRILLADEPTTALDVTVQAEVLNLLRQLQSQRSMAMIFITHDLGILAEVADRILVMYQGQVVEQGSAAALLRRPQHPYTQGLLACRPVLDRRLKRLPTIDDYLNTQDPNRSVDGSLTPILTLQEYTETELTQRIQSLQQRSPLLAVQHLKTYFPVKAGVFQIKVGDFKAVDDVSFEIYPGETLGLVGESGCGKTTLARTILRLVDATSGEIIFDGDDLTTLKGERLRRIRRDIQLIFQDPFSSLDPRMSVGDAVMEPMVLHGIGRTQADRQSQAQDLFRKVGLDPSWLKRMPHEFSGGQRQRICIARALAPEPRLVICDEAVSALDVSVQAQVLNLLKQLQEDLDLTYLFISHDLAVVKFMSDRILVMNRGRIEEVGTADTIYRDSQSAYTRQLIAAVPKGIPPS